MAERRANEEIAHVWMELLYFLHVNPTGVVTKKLATYVSQAVSQTRGDLNNLKKKRLVRSKKVGGTLLWYVSSPQGTPTDLWGERHLPNRKTIRRTVNKARRRKGVDASHWKSVKLGQMAYEKQVPGALVAWSVACEIIQSYVGPPKNLLNKLSMGCGSTALWTCGCQVVVSWKGNETTTECRLPVCDRLINLGEKQAKLVHAGRGTKKAPWSSNPAHQRECWVVVKAPRTKKVGDLYVLTCGCIACVSRVTNAHEPSDELKGVIGPGRGKLVCFEHLTEQRALGRPV